MRSFVFRWLTTTVAVMVAASVLHGIRYDSVGSLIGAALLLGILNAFVRPVLLILSAPLILLTLGFFILVVNGLLLWFVPNIVPGFHVDNFGSAFWGAIVIGLVSWMQRIFPWQRRPRSCLDPPHSNQERARSRYRTGRSLMTYCLGMLCRTGAVFLSDSRTSAGMDNITMRSKMRVYEKPSERVICIMTSGNLSLTQATLALIDDDLVLANNEPASETIMNTQTLYETARYVGTKVRAVEKRDRVALEADGFDFNINLIVGGQIAGMTPEIHLIYPQGNSIHATRDYPFLQIGETKYGKPILDRGFNYETSLSDAVKFGIISIDATMKSNVAVGPPIDLLCYELDSLVANLRMRLDEDDPYLQEIGRKWQNGIVKLVKDMPAPEFTKPSLGFATAA